DPDAGEAQFKPAVLNGLYGQLHLNADGSWAYTLDNTNPKVQGLPAGGSLSDQLLVLSADGTAHQVRIQISGTDDAAQVSGATSGQVREDVVMTASGQLTVRDIDQGETPQFQSETLQGIYGQLSIDATGQWHYQLDPAASQQLQNGVKARESFTVLASDAKGHQVSQQVLVDITGTNDAARISGTSSGQVTEDTLTHTGGKLDVQDVDRGEAHFQAGDQSGSYGSLHLEPDGTWGYTLNNSSPRVQELPAGASATETFTVRSADGTTHQLTVQIAGTNDAARISGTSSGQVTEDRPRRSPFPGGRSKRQLRQPAPGCRWHLGVHAEQQQLQGAGITCWGFRHGNLHSAFGRWHHPSAHRADRWHQRRRADQRHQQRPGHRR
ncbi:MAG: hypothetical protein EBZ51_13220, partial [Synechococcaceae bacterium WB9_2_112]|nr:hypothetical protein [Synechococcaceae bacterium WB9_2_112]